MSLCGMSLSPWNAVDRSSRHARTEKQKSDVKSLELCSHVWEGVRDKRVRRLREMDWAELCTLLGRSHRELEAGWQHGL